MCNKKVLRTAKMPSFFHKTGHQLFMKFTFGRWHEPKLLNWLGLIREKSAIGSPTFFFFISPQGGRCGESNWVDLESVCPLTFKNTTPHPVEKPGGEWQGVWESETMDHVIHCLRILPPAVLSFITELPFSPSQDLMMSSGPSPTGWVKDGNHLENFEEN